MPAEATVSSPPHLADTRARAARWRAWLAAPALLALAFAVYLPCLSGPLLWDDTGWLVGLEWNLRDAAGLWRIWTRPGAIEQYYPLTATSFWFDYQCWGRGATFPLHVENVLLHGGGAALFWLLLRRLQARGAWIAAALYCVHPVMVESVAWITERKNVLCTFFALAALLAHGAGAGWWAAPRRLPRPLLTALATLLFLLAILSKISAAVLPPAVLVIGWWRTGEVRWKQDGLRVLPWLIAVAVLLPVTHALEQQQMRHGDFTPGLGWPEKLLLASQLPWFYAGKLLWPRHLCLIYEPWPLQPGVWWQWSGAAALVIGLAVLLWQRRRGALALALLFLGALFPVLGFFEVNGMKYAWAADRWVYLPALAFFTAAGAALSSLPGKWTARLACALLLSLLAARCLRQAALYADLDRFWLAAIHCNPSPWKARNDYAGQLLDAGRNEEAARQLEEALRLKPAYATARVNLASALENLGRHQEALAEMDRAIALQPENNAAMHYNRAVILDQMGRGSEAEAALREAIRQRPDFFAAHNDLGNKLLLSRRLDEAMACFDKLLELRPGNAKALTSIGNVHFLRGRTAEAIAAFDAALRDDPEIVGALANSAWLLATAGDPQLRSPAKALRHARKAAELTGRKDPSILQILAAALADNGDFDQAIEVAGEAAALARASGMTALAASLDEFVRLFEQQQPYRLPGR